MLGGTVWSSDALWNGVTLLNDAAVGVYGMILSAAFCGITWTRGKKWTYGLSMAAILLAQAAVYGMTTDLQLLKLLYPLVTHMPLVLVLAIIERKLLWPTISVLTAYLCCQLRRWLALLLTALMSGGAEVQTAAELALTLPLLLGLLYFVAPAVRTIAGYKPAMQVRFGLIPAVGYLFDYLTRIYTDLLAQGTPAAVEFMPFVCCVAYLAFVLRSSAENETRLRLEQTQENLHLQVTQATREIASPAGVGAAGQHLSPRPAPPHAVSGRVHRKRPHGAGTGLYPGGLRGDREPEGARFLRKRDGEPDPVGLCRTGGGERRAPAGAGGGAPFYPGGGDGSVRTAVQRAGKRPACLPAAASDG